MSESERDVVFFLHGTISKEPEQKGLTAIEAFLFVIWLSNKSHLSSLEELKRLASSGTIPTPFIPMSLSIRQKVPISAKPALDEGGENEKGTTIILSTSYTTRGDRHRLGEVSLDISKPLVFAVQDILQEGVLVVEATNKRLFTMKGMVFWISGG